MITLSTFHFPLPTAATAAPVFPTSAVEASSLGRGGTAIAAPGGVNSVLGNPATLTPAAQFQLLAEYMRDAQSGDKAWVLGISDRSSSIRGAALYVSGPEFAGFEEELWG